MQTRSPAHPPLFHSTGTFLSSLVPLGAGWGWECRGQTHHLPTMGVPLLTAGRGSATAYTLNCSAPLAWFSLEDRAHTLNVSLIILNSVWGCFLSCHSLRTHWRTMGREQLPRHWTLCVLMNYAGMLQCPLCGRGQKRWVGHIFQVCPMWSDSATLLGFHALFGNFLECSSYAVHW